MKNLKKQNTKDAEKSILLRKLGLCAKNCGLGGTATLGVGAGVVKVARAGDLGPGVGVPGGGTSLAAIGGRTPDPELVILPRVRLC